MSPLAPLWHLLQVMDISRNALASGFFIAGLFKQPGASALRLMGRNNRGLAPCG